MIHLLPKLRLPRWLRTPRPVPTIAPTPSLTLEPSKETAQSFGWRHAPPEPRERATECGAPSCVNPVGDSVDGEFCKASCAAAWLTANTDTITKFIGPTPVKASTPRIADPPWLAAISDWDRKKAAAVVAARKVSAATYVPGSAAKTMAAAMSDAEPIHPLTPAPGDVANRQRAQDDRIQQASAIEGEAA